jgi:AGCS family alanine or glycine:cation symporter
VILAHVGDLPAALARIVASACRGDAIYGGALGALIAVWSRAAQGGTGTGAAAIAHATARTTAAVRQGLVAQLGPLFATVVVGTMTALVITVSGAAEAPANAELIAAGNGGALLAAAFASVAALRAWFPWLLLLAFVLFAYATMIAWSYYGERCATRLFGARASLPFRLVFLAFTVLGSVVTATSVLGLGDLMFLLMAFPNVIGLCLLGGVVRRDLRDYEQQLRSGAIRVQQ